VAVGASELQLRLSVWVADPLRRATVAAALRERLVRRLAEDGLLGGEPAPGSAGPGPSPAAPDDTDAV
jgi:hypothetical protein